VRGGIVHAAAGTGGAEAAALAGEGDQQFGAAGRAAHPREAVGENPAPEIALELADDEPGQARLAALLRLGEEGLPVLPDRRVQERALGLAPAIGGAGRVRACSDPIPAHGVAA